MTIPILLYHAVTESPGQHVAPFAVTPRIFRTHLDLLLEMGYRCVRMRDLDGEAAGPQGPGRDPDRLAVITFDDGYADFASAALPALRARAMQSTLYVTTGWLRDGGPRAPGPTDVMLSWSQLPELLEQGVEIGAHSHSHPELDTLPAAGLRNELVRPKRMLEDTLGRPVDSFAYPHGYNGRRVRRMTAGAGYDSGVSVHNFRHHRGEDRYDISRLLLTNRLGRTELADWLEHGPVRRRESVTTKGWRAYRRGRALLRGRPGTAYS
jgi:peptidoglycan/xylan/chitin deacetylase (PgdA/CDA1 family)